MRIVVLLVAVGGLAGGCASEAPPLRVDDGGLSDGDGGGSANDADRDGLCDALERMSGTDPMNPDTDADGFSDLVELNAESDPGSSISPSSASVVFLRQSPGAQVSVVPTVMVTGNGLDYAGAVEALPARGDVAGQTARDFVEATVALSASPDGNVATIEAAGARFRGVNGPTELAFEVQLRFGEDTRLPCARGFPFRYNVKRSDSVAVTSESFLLVVIPEGTTLAAVSWCVATESCVNAI